MSNFQAAFAPLLGILDDSYIPIAHSTVLDTAFLDTTFLNNLLDPDASLPAPFNPSSDPLPASL